MNIRKKVLNIFPLLFLIENIFGYNGTMIMIAGKAIRHWIYLFAFISIMPLPFAINVCFLYYRKLSLSFLSDSLEAVIFFGVFSPHDLRTDTESQDSHITTSRTLLAVLSATVANEHKIILITTACPSR